MDKRIPVLDKGYVELVDVMGSDLTVANAARASFAKRSTSFSSADAKLVNFLYKHEHTSPFRHAMLQFEVKAPLMVARQWWKYVVGSDHTMDGWNEASRRYITMEPEFYIPGPGQWRSAPDDRKQGSGATLPDEVGQGFTEALREAIRIGKANYDRLLEDGVAPEQARLCLPMYAMYTNWWWTCSLQSVMHFIKQRLAEDAQSEIRDYALAIREVVAMLFPVSLETIMEN